MFEVGERVKFDGEEGAVVSDQSRAAGFYFKNFVCVKLDKDKGTTFCISLIHKEELVYVNTKPDWEI